MHKKYLNPPIIEAVCEFRLPDDTHWDSTIPGIIYNEVKNDFPRRETKTIQDIQLSANQSIIKNTELTIFYKEDRSSLLQIRNNLLAINKLKPYLGWNEFKKDIFKTYDILVKELKFQTLKRIGLRYINQIEIPKNSELSHFFNISINLADSLNKNAEFSDSTLILNVNDTDKCKVRIESSVQQPKDKNIITLDIDYFLHKENIITTNDAKIWVESAHEQVYKIFDESITDNCRILFGDKL